MKKILSSLALFTFIAGTAGTLSNGVVETQNNKSLVTNIQLTSSLAPKVAASILASVLQGLSIDASSLTSENKKGDALGLFWRGFDPKFETAKKIGSETPFVGKEIVSIISNLTINSLTVEDSSQLLVKGTNPIKGFLVVSSKYTIPVWNTLYNVR